MFSWLPLLTEQVGNDHTVLKICKKTICFQFSLLTDWSCYTSMQAPWSQVDFSSKPSQFFLIIDSFAWALAYFVISHWQGMFNMCSVHTGPLSLSSLFEKVRLLIQSTWSSREWQTPWVFSLHTSMLSSNFIIIPSWIAVYCIYTKFIGGLAILK